jgi:hypothetical protein
VLANVRLKRYLLSGRYHTGMIRRERERERENEEEEEARTERENLMYQKYRLLNDPPREGRQSEHRITLSGLVMST